MAKTKEIVVNIEGITLGDMMILTDSDTPLKEKLPILDKLLVGRKAMDLRIADELPQVMAAVKAAFEEVQNPQ